MITTKGSYCDGERLTPRPVILDFEPAGRLKVSGAATDQVWPLVEVKISDRLGEMPRFLHLPNGATIETPDNGAVDAALLQQNRGRHAAWIHCLEAHSTFAAIATVLIVALVGIALKFGLPALSRQTARRMPPALEQQAGRVALASVRKILGPSQLSRAERDRVKGALDRLLAARSIGQSVRLEFHAMGRQYPNAFALPGGIIIVSDELVALADQEGELEAVLAHELGHLVEHHGLQSVLRNSFALLIVTTVTGDLSTLTTFAGTIPFLLLQNGYAREFEQEADTYGRDLLKTAGIDVQHFADILTKLEAARPTAGVDFSYLSTHPGTKERIQALQSASKK